ncbi:histidine phosphatase family protein [Candidatus Pacearchaeota archaeon]|nr:histidine phosphatase family protein [Candidatus Pacearchaeota archaeon]
MRCYIYLFRHGMTEDNAEGVFSGWRDTKLTERGIRDAKIVALRLKDKRVDAAYRTRLSRSRDTLKEVLKFHPECRRIIQDDRIIERNYGKLQGKTHLEVVEKYGPKMYDKWHRSYNSRPPYGESFKDIEKRVRSFIRELLKMMKEKKVNVAISAHGNSMRPFRRYFEKLSIKQMCALYNDYEAVYIYSVEV